MNKLGIICASLSRGGAERVTVHLAKYMKKRGIDVYIITASIGNNEYSVPDGIERINLTNSSNKLAGYFIQIKNLNKVIKDKNIDTVLIMGVSTCIYAIPGTINTDAKVIVSERNDPVHFDGKRIVKILSRYLMKKADGFVFQTDDAKKFYDKELKGTKTVIPNPLFVDELPEPYVGEREKVIVNVGRLVSQKNQKMLINAFSEIANEIEEYKLVIYGEGNLRKELENQILQLKMKDRILLSGNVVDLYERIKKASVFVLSSDFEGMPNALIEAMAIGLPCISTDCPCGGPKSLIKNGENGLLFEVGNKNQLINAIEYMINNPDKAKQMSEKAVNIRNTLNANHICEKWYNYIMSIN
jgi:glycosyltransferase involved in cell wall biosynthesis